MQLTIRWMDGLGFETDLEGHRMVLDGHPESGGKGRGPSPKILLLLSLAGCTGMDVISILSKMREKVDSFEVHSRASLASEHPKKIETVEITYRFTGPDLCRDKVRKAVSLSEEKYCGVAATLRPGVDMSSRIVVNGSELD